MVGVGVRERVGGERAGEDRRVGWYSSCIWELPFPFGFWEGMESLVAEGLRLMLRGAISGSLSAAGGDEGRWILGPMGRAGLECMECIARDDDGGGADDE